MYSSIPNLKNILNLPKVLEAQFISELLVILAHNGRNAENSKEKNYFQFFHKIIVKKYDCPMSAKESKLKKNSRITADATAADDPIAPIANPTLPPNKPPNNDAPPTINDEMRDFLTVSCSSLCFLLFLGKFPIFSYNFGKNEMVTDATSFHKRKNSNEMPPYMANKLRISMCEWTE